MDGRIKSGHDGCACCDVVRRARFVIAGRGRVFAPDDPVIHPLRDD
jgi:hypothetical protein